METEMNLSYRADYMKKESPIPQSRLRGAEMGLDPNTPPRRAGGTADETEHNEHPVDPHGLDHSESGNTFVMKGRWKRFGENVGRVV